MPYRRVHTPMSQHSFAFLRLDDSTNSLVTRDHKDVCPLSREVISQPLSTRLQDGVRFFLVPNPAPPWTDLAAFCPRRERYGVTTFRLQKYVDLGTCCRSGGMWVTRTQGYRGSPTSGTILVQAY